MECNKITTGFVIQRYATEGDKVVCIGQEFIAGDQVDWETLDGDKIRTPANSVYQPFNMSIN